MIILENVILYLQNQDFKMFHDIQFIVQKVKTSSRIFENSLAYICGEDLLKMGAIVNCLI